MFWGAFTHAFCLSMLLQQYFSLSLFIQNIKKLYFSLTKSVFYDHHLCQKMLQIPSMTPIQLDQDKSAALLVLFHPVTSPPSLLLCVCQVFRGGHVSFHPGHQGRSYGPAA